MSFSLRLLLIVGWSWCVIPPALAQETMALAMANAIARMMEMMGFANSSVPPLGMGAPPLTGFPSAFSTLPALPTPPAVSGSMSTAVPLQQVLAQFNQAWSAGGVAAQTTALEGIWEDNQGGLLIVQRQRYRLYASCQGAIDGDIVVGNGRVALTNQRENFTQSFEFALDQGRLVLRNHNGDVFLYRLLILDVIK